MSLTGGLFLNGLIVITIICFVLLIVGWHRLDGKTPLRVAGRVGAVLLVNLLVLLTAATQLNATYLFFAGWGDLEGAFTGHLVQTRLSRGGGAASAVNTHVSGTAASASATVPPLRAKVSAAGVAQFTVTGPLSGLTGTVVVQLPPGYSTAGAKQHYPVIEAFSGYPGSPYSWIKVMQLSSAMETQVRAGVMRPALIVAPQIEFPAGVDTESVNGPSGTPQVETWLTQDVPTWVARTFRVESNRNAWATIGYSAGGWTAAMTTLLHPAQYGAAIVLGGYFRPEFGPFYQPFARRSPLGSRYNLPELVRRKRPPPVAMWIETSHSDAVSYHSSAAFLAATRAPLSVRAVVLQNAGHRISIWRQLLPETLTWLGNNVKGFHP